MQRYNKREKTQGRCSVCNQPIIVDKHDNGTKCNNCGWVQDGASIEIPDLPSPILISLDKAKELYRQGKPFKVDFNDFIEAFKMYGEMEFYYNKIRYGMSAPKGIIILFECDAKEPKVFEFQSIDEFIVKANIDGVLLKDLWDRIENPYWLQ